MLLILTSKESRFYLLVDLAPTDTCTRDSVKLTMQKASRFFRIIQGKYSYADMLFSITKKMQLVLDMSRCNTMGP
jgi:hypothetical protein